MIRTHIENLNRFFRNKRVVIAYSGGLDSTVLLEFALNNAQSVLAITVQSSLVPLDEQNFAIEYLRSRNVQFKAIEVDPLQHPEVISNTKRRCYYCKKLIFERIIEESLEFNPDFIVEGSNISDLSDYRPGLEAINELNIRSPFLELKISKVEIRGLAKIFTLTIAEKPATTCLATRIPYDQPITVEKLKRIEVAENFIKEEMDIHVLRVRDHEDIARIEIDERDFEKFLENRTRNSIKENLKKLGFSYIALDLAGYKQGSMNINIEEVKND